MSHLAYILINLILALAAELEKDLSEIFRRETEPVQWSPVPNKMCALEGRRATIIGDQLFFLGGLYWFDNASPVFEDHLYALNLNQSFSLNTEFVGNDGNDFFVQSQIPPGVPWNTSGIFFRSNDTFYLPGGATGQGEAWTNSFWSYNVSTSSWNDIPFANRSRDIDQGGALQAAPYVSIPEKGLSFVSGGYDDDLSTGWDNLLKFDSSVPGEPIWSNTTSVFPPPPEWVGPWRLGASMAYVPVGDAGLILFLGGSKLDVSNSSRVTPNNFSLDISLSTIDIYDISGDRYYTVNATDILSLPSFEWIQISDENNIETRANSGTSTGRVDPQCSAWAGSLGWVVGGLVTYGQFGTQSLNTSCGQYYPPIRLLNLNNYAWLNDHDASYYQDYQVHPNVSRIIGGGPQGGATQQQPDAGWPDPALGAAFAKILPAYQPPVDLFNANASSNGKDSPPTSPHGSSHVGAIVGGLVGGVLGLTIVAGGCWFLLRWRRQQLTNYLERQESPQRTYIPGQYELDGNIQPIHEKLPCDAPYELTELPHEHTPAELAAPSVPAQSQTTISDEHSGDRSIDDLRTS
ncbi:MAG: hypothetical protein M1820_006233 [Bogoriella megaspora]|nr:MAG: hypothetical protein M1820_006233 [Bogoriella megaspora]